jgi:ribosomal protein S18 acetylase RimI-like enzyme
MRDGPSCGTLPGMNAIPPSGHPLDNVIWNALSTVQADWSRGGALARRFRPEFARFAGMPALSAPGFDALAADMATGEIVALFEPEDIHPGPRFEIIDRKNLLQMTGAVAGAIGIPGRFRPLGPSDVRAMTALVHITAPGPWFERSAELGRFVGFESDGQLVAMAGERMRVPGHTEISAVCCHPEWRGQGLAADLMRVVSQAIVGRGDTPFVHVLAGNSTAVDLYERLGLRPRRTSRLTIIQRNSTPA